MEAISLKKKLASNQDFSKNNKKSLAASPKKLPVISKTPVPGISKEHPKVFFTQRNDFELDLKLKHRILKSMVAVEKEVGSVQDTSSLNYSFKRMSAGMKMLGKSTNTEKLLSKVISNLHSPSHFSMRLDENELTATEKCLIREHNSWAEKRGKKTMKKKSSFSSFLVEFFECIDENDSDLLKPKDFIIPFMTYGLASNVDYIERVSFIQALKVVFESKDLNSNITKQKFLNKLRLDKATSSILQGLQLHTDRNFNNINSLFPIKYQSLDNFILMVKLWWSELSSGQPMVHSSKVSLFLMAKHLIPGIPKALKICAKFCIDEFFNAITFENIFLKSIFIAQLLNIRHGIELQETQAPLHLKLAVYQRNLLLKGVDPKKNEKERKILRAVYKYCGQAEPARDKRRTTLKENVALAEKLNQLKLKQVIYEAEKQGVEFVSQKGEIRNDINATWDVKNAIQAKDEDVKQSFRAKDYLESFKRSNSPSTLSAHPYERNVKIFRDNFLFEKFQSVANHNFKSNSHGRSLVNH